MDLLRDLFRDLEAGKAQLMFCEEAGGHVNIALYGPGGNFYLTIAPADALIEHKKHELAKLRVRLERAQALLAQAGNVLMG